ncbi:MAG: type I-MYXAN CRISPR-associated protein Cas6/Cmx6 [Candidatus Oxydemutatoraceae bacterium WSBS_2016_MAG_OTU14]
MHWQEDTEENKKQHVSTKVADLGFRVNCPCLPMDHKWILKKAIKQTLPWIDEDSCFAIHDIHGAESGNGWIRPDDSNALLHLSQRTSLYIRTPLDRVAEVQELSGTQYNLDGYPLALEKSKLRQLFAHPTLFVRYYLSANNNETDLLRDIVRWLKEHRIEVPRIMPGKQHQVYTPTGTLTAHSFMVDGLQGNDSLWLQEHGIGNQQLLGCGIFIPHKGIDAVHQLQQN